MKIYDITQEVLSSVVFPGDPSPRLDTICSMEKGDIINLTSFFMCSHNGTHMDAPSHFIKDGKTIGEIPLYKTVGKAYVSEFCGEIKEKDIKEILKKAKALDEECAKRILIKGKAFLSLEGAKYLAEEKIYLFGNESQTVGPENEPLEVHKAMLGVEIVLLEGVRLGDVAEGEYMLFSPPLFLGKAEGAPCRAVLVEI